MRSVLQACLGRLAERCRCFVVLPGTLPANHSCFSSVSGNPIREQLIGLMLLLKLAGTLMLAMLLLVLRLF
ncbi:TPA: hypothetical protein RMY57_001579 [Salmonella enterica subsp. enterica serovar Typhi]|nr:hypothetical protein [Salmonella enterica subsp. enterica serovar Typhi]